MKTVPPLRALAIAACLVAAAPAWGAGKAPPASSPGASREARTLIGTGRFEEALNLLRPLTQGRTVRANVLFLFGVAAIGASQKHGVGEERRDALLDEAIGVLRAVLVKRPGLIRMRLELARAFFLKGEDRLATRHFEQVLAGNPPAAVALNVNRFLGAIRARKRWSLHVGAALAPDTNIGASSDERIIHLPFLGQLLPFRRDADELTTSGIGVSAWVGGEYQHPLDPRWRLRAGGGVSRLEYKGSEFDRLNLSVHVGPRWLIGRASEASLLLWARHGWAGSGLSGPAHLDVGLRLEGRHRANRRTTLNANLSRHERRYDERTRLDGPITDISVGAGFVASPTLRLNASAGWGRERPGTRNQRHSRHWVQAGLTTLLPRGFTLGGAATLRWTGYQGNWFPFTTDGSPRRDVTRILRFFAHNRAFTVEGFSPQVSVVSEARTSNAQLHGYQRIFGELRFVRLF